MKHIKVVIFDLDGTLVDAYPAINGSFNYTMKSMGYPRQRARVIRRAVGWGDDNLLRPFVRKEDLSRALTVYRRHHKLALLRGASLFPRVYSVLDYLRSKRYKLAVASNRPTRFSRILIRRFRLNKYFDYVLCADKLRHIKPHPEILNKIVRKFSLTPQEALYVGDMIIDAQAARRAKIRSVIITTGSSTKSEIRRERPYRIIGRISQLLRIL